MPCVDMRCNIVAMYLGSYSTTSRIAPPTRMSPLAMTRAVQVHVMLNLPCHINVLGGEKARLSCGVVPCVDMRCNILTMYLGSYSTTSHIAPPTRMSPIAMTRAVQVHVMLNFPCHINVLQGDEVRLSSGRCPV